MHTRRSARSTNDRRIVPASRIAVRAQRLRPRLVLLVSAIAVLAGTPLNQSLAQAQVAPAVFPTVTGRNLEGRELSLPAEFAGERNVVIVAFRQRQQRDVNSWLPALKELQREDLGLEIYEIPTLGRGWIPLRGWIDGGMASGIRDRATREATVTLYLAKGPFKEALAIRGEGEIQLLLMGRDGIVRFRARGAYSPAGLAGLRQALREAGGLAAGPAGL